MKDFRAYIRENNRWFAGMLFLVLVMTATMLLNGIPFWEIGYGMLLCLSVITVLTLAGYGKYRKGLLQLRKMQKNIGVALGEMRTPEYLYERQYQDCIRILAREKDRIENEMRAQQQDLTTYYSMWVHQIKTPIAALKLLIDEEMNAYLDMEELEENDTRVISVQQKQNELFRIEQYVDMALQYMRLGAQTNDFVFEKVRMDDVIKPSILKYAKQFIQKHLRLQYTPQDIAAVTDQKWLGFVLDQLLSNAVKYTRQGGVQICAFCSEAGVHIVVEDTGIGISAQDLPRVCEKGYTGCNGHVNPYSTGIGLYLCKSILDRLGHPFYLTSQQGKGTRAEVVIGQSASRQFLS